MILTFQDLQGHKQKELISSYMDELKESIVKDVQNYADDHGMTEATAFRDLFLPFVKKDEPFNENNYFEELELYVEKMATKKAETWSARVEL